MNECGVGFKVYYPPFPEELVCGLERWHDGPHEAMGVDFVWGPRDQSLDFQVVRMREAEEKVARRRRGSARLWQMLMAQRKEKGRQ